MPQLVTVLAARWVRVAVVLSVLLYGASLLAPAISFARVQGHHPHPSHYVQIESKTGFEMLFSSLFGPFYMNFAGFANLLLVVSWWMLWFQHGRGTKVLLSLALLLAMQTFQLYSSGMPADEGSVMFYEMLRPLVGFYLWVASIAVPLAALLLQRRPKV
jgi:hypothetical protein